ncbi:protein PRRC2C-like [Rhopalosiphum padi]|uniref:protein PRRC2C-like n=1 Tax=Rhopalosiphum padi TaxID=40932 RepID=UPI00298DB17D|nr:protein PRRC2C-like [Rhopalosiphum padi]
MNCIQVCLVLVAGCMMLASADLTSYKLGYSTNDLNTAELDAIKDCDPLTSGYMVTGSTPAPLMRTAVDIEPARIMSVTPSPILSTASEYVSVSTPAPILRTAVDIEPARIVSMTPSPIISTASEFVSVSTPAPIMRTAIDIEPARIIDTAPLKLESRIATSPLLNAFRPTLTTFDSTAWQANLENASPAPIAMKTITKTANLGSSITSTKLEAMPTIRSQYTLATAAPLIQSKIAMPIQQSIPITRPLTSRILPLPSVSTSYSYIPRTYASSYLNTYTAPQYYSTSTRYLAAPQFYSSAASIAPQYYSSAAAIAPQYYSSAAFAPQYYSAAPKYYSSVSLAADEPCDKK